MLEPTNGLTRVRFDQMAMQVNDRVDNPAEAGVERYVGLEHLDPDSLRIRRWGEPTEVESTKLRFQPGDIIFGKRRAYQRKVAIADFEGICSAHAMVLRAKPETVLPEFLPFFMQSDLFMERAQSISVGSLSPTINWRTLAAEEFLVPPLQEQARLVECLGAADQNFDALDRLAAATNELYEAVSLDAFAGSSIIGTKPSEWARKSWKIRPLAEMVRSDSPICYGIVQVGEYDPEGVPTLAIHNLAGDFIQNVHRTLSSVEAAYQRSRVTPGDVLISIKGTIGEVAIVPDSFSGNISRDLAKIRFDKSLVVPDYFYHLYRSVPYRKYIRSLIVGSTRAELSIDTLRRMEVPVPPTNEQATIASRLNVVTSSAIAAQSRRVAAKSIARELSKQVFG